MNKLLLICVITSHFGFAAKSTLKVHLGLSDCITCYSALSFLENLKNCEKEIIVCRKDSAVVSELLLNYKLPSDLQFNYNNRPINTASYCLFYFNNLLRDSFDLKALSEKTRVINNADKSLQKFYFPKSFTIDKDRADISPLRNNTFFIYDYLLNKVLAFKINPLKDTLEKVLEIKGSQFVSKVMVRMAGLDSLLYEADRKFLTTIGKSFPHIENAYSNDTSLFLLLNFPSPYIDHRITEDTIIGMSFFIYHKNLRTKFQSLTYINDKSLISKYPDRYFINNAQPFFTSDSVIFLPINDFKPTEIEVKLFSKWSKKNGKYSFSEFSEMSYNTRDYTDKKIGNYMNVVNKQYYFSPTLSFIVDLEKKKMIKEKCITPLQDRAAIDIFEQPNGILVLTNSGNMVALNRYDFSKSLTTSKNLVVPDNCQLRTLKFSDKDSLQFVDKDFSAFYIMDLTQ